MNGITRFGSIHFTPIGGREAIQKNLNPLVNGVASHHPDTTFTVTYETTKQATEQLGAQPKRYSATPAQLEGIITTQGGNAERAEQDLLKTMQDYRTPFWKQLRQEG